MTEYKTPVVFLRLSKTKKQVYGFNIDGRLGDNCKSVIVNVADLEKVLDGSAEYAKLSVMQESGGDSAEDDLSSPKSPYVDKNVYSRKETTKEKAVMEQAGKEMGQLDKEMVGKRWK
jgi:hypothetical protein